MYTCGEFLLSIFLVVCLVLLPQEFGIFLDTLLYVRDESCDDELTTLLRKVWVVLLLAESSKSWLLDRLAYLISHALLLTQLQPPSSIPSRQSHFSSPNTSHHSISSHTLI